MLNRHKISNRWENFANQVLIGIDPLSVQYSEMRRAFYSGAMDMLYETANFSDNLTEDEVCEILEYNKKELNEFFEGLVRVVAIIKSN